MTTTAEPGTDVALYDDSASALRVPALPNLPDVDSWIRAMSSIAKLAGQICETSFVPKDMRGDAASVTAAILTGREFGWGPMMALRSIYVSNGTPGLYAKTKRAMILAAGHEFDITEWDDTHCKASARRHGSHKPPLIVEYTMKDAERAGLPKRNANYHTSPRAMLLARVTTLVDSALFADVTNGLATAELLDDADVLADAAGASMELPARTPPPVGDLRQRVAAHTVTATVVTPDASPAAPDAPPSSVPAAAPPSAEVAAAGEAQHLKTGPQYIAERLEKLGVTGVVRTAGRLAGRQLADLDELTDAEAVTVMRTLSTCKTAADLDGVLADLELASDPREDGEPGGE